MTRIHAFFVGAYRRVHKRAIGALLLQLGTIASSSVVAAMFGDKYAKFVLGVGAILTALAPSLVRKPDAPDA